jgi:hypothetical protein
MVTVDTSTVTVALLFVLFIVAVATGAYVQYYLKKKRREEIATMARQLGLSYSRDDIVGLLGYPFALFRKGDGRGAENLLTGTWQGLPIVEADYWYYDESTDSEGHRSKTYHYFSTAIVKMGAFGSPLTISREDIFTKLADHMGLPDIQFETEEFNQAFNVKCKDRKFANDVIDQRMMQWLLAAGKEWSFEVSGQDILVFCRRRKPMDLLPLLGTAKGFMDHVPRVVYELYGPGAQQ